MNCIIDTKQNCSTKISEVSEEISEKLDPGTRRLPILVWLCKIFVPYDKLKNNQDTKNETERERERLIMK